jgi:hypothetical protein
VKNSPAVILWAVAFAYMESAVVEYLRALYYPLESGGFLFPLQTIEEFVGMGEEHWRRLVIELGREFSTLVMLGAVGLMAGKNRREAIAHFMIAFGVWDICYYLWLKVFLGWPASIMTWDLLFLLPVPWASPVLAPVIISAAMIVAGFAVLYSESRGFVLATTRLDWILIIGGGITVIASFCWDYRNIMQGGLPNPFNWPLFIVGLAVSSITFLFVLHRNLTRGP